jgi:Mg/Co/Ni transporter MgtE
MTQNGSRVLQSVLKNTSKDVITKIFSEIANDLQALITDSYANYFCQKFFNYLSIDDRCKFLSKVI